MRKSSLNFLVLSLSLASTACSPTPTSPQTEALQNKIVLSIEKKQILVTPGDKATLEGHIHSTSSKAFAPSFTLVGEIDGITLISSAINDLTQEDQRITLTLLVSESAAPGKRNIFLVDRYDKKQQLKIPLNVGVLSSGFILNQDPRSIIIYPGEEADVPVSIRRVNGYAGTVSLSLLGLPQDVTSQAVTISLDSDLISLNLKMKASKEAKISRNVFSIRAVGENIDAQSGRVVTVYPYTIKLPGNSYRVLGTESVDKLGNWWIGSSEGITKISPDLTSKLVESSELICLSVIVGQDGGIWSTGEPYTRFDPSNGVVNHYSSPSGASGCGGGQLIDSKRRNWRLNGGVYRSDLIEQKFEKAPGTESWYGYLKLDNDLIWMAQNDNSVYSLNTDSFEIHRYTLPGISLNENYFPFKGKLYFIDQTKLSAFDPLSGYVKQANTGSWKIDHLYGVDGQENVWLRATRFDDGVASLSALLYVSSSGNILRQLPDLGGTFAVTSTGGLWYSPEGPQTTGTRVAYIAP